MKILTIIFILFSTNAFSLTFDDLSPEEKIQVLSSKIVLKPIEVKGAPWPEVFAISAIKATPLEATSIFSAYDLQKNYIPDVLKSEIIKYEVPGIVHVDYEMHLPWPLPNPKYVHAHVLKELPKGYEVSWYMIKSSVADEVIGSAKFIKHKDKTLMIYRCLVRPSSIFAGFSFIKNGMLKDVTRNLQAVVDYIEFSKINDLESIGKYSAIVDKTLKKEMVYQDLLNRAKL